MDQESVNGRFIDRGDIEPPTLHPPCEARSHRSLLS
jgi:hypothetical protein